jgi:hypothetical protein
VIPAGQYQAQIVESSVVDTKARTGKMLKLTWEIMSGQFERRKVFDQINIVNQSAKAQEIGQRELAPKFVRRPAPVSSSNSDALHFKPVMIRVAIEKQDGFDDKNIVKRVKPLAGAAAPAHARLRSPRLRRRSSQRAGAAATGGRPATGSRPWAR